MPCGRRIATRSCSISDWAASRPRSACAQPIRRRSRCCARRVAVLDGEQCTDASLAGAQPTPRLLLPHGPCRSLSADPGAGRQIARGAAHARPAAPAGSWPSQRRNGSGARWLARRHEHCSRPSACCVPTADRSAFDAARYMRVPVADEQLRRSRIGRGQAGGLRRLSRRQSTTATSVGRRWAFVSANGSIAGWKAPVAAKS